MVPWLLGNTGLTLQLVGPLSVADLKTGATEASLGFNPTAAALDVVVFESRSPHRLFDTAFELLAAQLFVLLSLMEYLFIDGDDGGELQLLVV